MQISSLENPQIILKTSNQTTTTYYPRLKLFESIMVLFVNYKLAGFGTILASILDPNGFNTKYFIVAALFQIILANFIIGWLWGLFDSMVLVFISFYMVCWE